MKKMTKRSARRPNRQRQLSAEARRLWRSMSRDYDINDPGGLAILQAGLEAFDRMRQAQADIRRDGATFKDRFGQLRGHPSITVERDSRAAWLAALKQLNLDLEPLRDHRGRPAGQIGG